jgi:hypothetical protein
MSWVQKKLEIKPTQKPVVFESRNRNLLGLVREKTQKKPKQTKAKSFKTGQ